MSDQFLFASSMEGQTSAEPMVTKTVTYISDSNNGSYQSGQVQIDTSSLSNSGKWVAYNAAYLEIPLVLALYPTTAVTGFDTNLDCNFAAGLKNCFAAALIHSFQLEVNNVSVQQLTPYTGFYINYKMMTSMSQDDLHKVGPSIGFYPDTCDSFTFNTAASPEGEGSSNNRNFGLHMLYPSNQGRIYTSATVAAGASPITISQCLVGTPLDSLYTTNTPSQNNKIPSTANFGFFKRQTLYAFQPSAAATSANSSNHYSLLLSESNARTLWTNYFATVSSSTTATKVWYILAQIRLKDMSDFFAQVPLTRGLYCRLVLNLNLATATLTSSLTNAVAGATGTYGSPAVTSFTQSSISMTQSTCPMMFASSNVGQGAQGVDTVGSKTWKLQLAIASLTPSQNGGLYSSAITHPLTTCRLYAPAYVMNAAAESMYLQENPTKTIIYKDIINYIVPATATGVEINQLLTNGVVAPKTLIVIPIFSAGDAGNKLSQIAAHQSVFAAEPGTTSPLAALTNFNVLLAGQTIYQLNQQYDFQSFTDELQDQNAINGGQTTGLNSGLIDQYSWSMAYRYYVTDLSRRTSGAEMNIPKSIQIQGQNLSARTVTYFCFVEVERSVTLSLLNGAILG